MPKRSSCIGCMTNINLMNIHSPTEEDTDVNHAQVMSNVFNIELSELDPDYSICLDCSEKLNNAMSFKQQVKLNLEFMRDDKADLLFLKSELPDSDDENAFSVIIVQPEDIVEENKATKMRGVGINANNINRHIKRRKVASRLIWTKSPRSRKAKVESDYIVDPMSLECKECGDKFESMYMLKIHLNTHNPVHVCKHCGKAFSRKSGLQSHLYTHDKGPHICNVCGQEFRSINTMRGHRRLKHEGGSVYSCKICGQPNATYHSQRSHLLKEHGIQLNMYHCLYCDKSFITSSKRSNHIARSHLKQRKHQCEHCGQGFSLPSGLRSHLAHVHKIGEKEHKCETCGKQYSRRYTLLEHMRIHIKDARYQCEYCDRRFIQKSSLKSHIVHTHTSIVEDATDIQV